MKNQAGLCLLLLLIALSVSCEKKTTIQASIPRTTEANGKSGIVSTAPNLTEMLYALALEDRVVGVTTACDFPEAAKLKPKVGGFMSLDMEAILATGAGALVALEGGLSERDRSRLQDAGMRIIELQTDKLEQILEGIETLGKELGVPESGTTLRTALEADLSRFKVSPGNRPRALIALSVDPLLLAGPKTFVHELMERAGLENGVRDSTLEYPTWDREALLAAKPDWILIASMDGKGKAAEAHLRKMLNSTDLQQSIQIGSIPADWVLRPGPRVIQGIQALKRATMAQGGKKP